MLRAASGAVAATGLAGVASAEDATAEVNVGYANERGRTAALGLDSSDN